MVFVIITEFLVLPFQIFQHTETMEADSDDELCLIDSGITSLTEVPVQSNLHSLDLHCNQIVRIENLLQSQNLAFLDLSSNLIHKIEGLSTLTNLKTLNLSSNRIQRVEGLRTLVSLIRIDLSYNEIGNVDGFLELSGSQYRLTHVKLQGNVLDSVQHVTHCLSKCIHLQSLVLSDGENSNPLCNRLGYERLLFAAIPQLRSFNDKNRKGQPVSKDEIGSIPALERYLDILSSSDVSQPGSLPLVTPKIDALLAAHRRKTSGVAEITSTTGNSDVETSPHDSSEIPKNLSSLPKASVYEKRLEMLELQLAGLQQNVVSATTAVASAEESDRMSRKHSAKRDVDETDESDDDTPPKVEKRKAGLTRGRNGQQSGAQPRKTRSNMGLGTRTPGRTMLPDSSVKSSRLSDQDADQKRRDELEKMCVELMKDLESERAEHLKVQHVARKLAERFAQQAEELQDQKLASEETRNHLKNVLAGEREEKLKLEAEVEVLRDQLQDEQRKFTDLERSETELRKSLKTREDMTAKMEQEYLRRKAELGKRAQEFQLKAAAMAREVELMRIEANDRNGKIQQLQELLANREQAHANELGQRVFVGSKEFKELVAKEIATVEAKHSMELLQLNSSLQSQKVEYAKLEDEFREALTYEEERYNELKATCGKLTLENERHRKNVSQAQEQNEKARETIMKLNELIKEQNGRLSELSKSKQEKSQKIKELESRLDERETKKNQLDVIRQENIQLLSQIRAVESIIEGLRSEKKLWGEELARQDSSLAKDRGRLEAKIEALETELGTTKKQLADETDLVRIKSKIIDDQNETVHKLKEETARQGRQLRESQDDLIAIQADLNRQVEEVTLENQKLREELSCVRTRSAELKTQKSELQKMLRKSQEANDHLSTELQDMRAKVGDVEERVHQHRSKWDEDLKKLTKERDVALEGQAVIEERMRTMDDAFRKQLDLKEESHQRKLEELLCEKRAEVRAAEQRTMEVEDEMREILREKEAMERKHDEFRKFLQKISNDQFS